VDQLERSIAIMPEVAHGWLLQKINKSSLRVAFDLGLAGIYPNAMKVTKRQIDHANESGLSVRTWGIGNSVQALKRAYKSGATGTTVDWPIKAHKMLASI
jgi:glycerophosphoryl diester phosphodiesterase